MKSRTTKVTLAASAVTLLCVGASLSASPQVIAETLGRDVHAFAPMDPSTYPNNTEQPPAKAMDAATASRQHSTMTKNGSWSASPAETEPTQRPEAPSSTVEIAGSGDPEPSEERSVEPDPQPTAEASRIESKLSESQPSPEPTKAQDAEEPIPEDLESPDSMTVIVNKLRPLPEDFAPDDLVELPDQMGTDTYELREPAAEAAKELFAAAREDGIELTVVSAYRSYAYQQELYDNYIAEHGSEVTNEMSAMPGHSEHQTGLALDVDSPDGQHTLQQSFGDTEAGQWLAEHAHEYGFVIRYPQDAQEITGFSYEPWHLRYFGEQYAKHIAEGSGVAETEFGLPPAPDYAS